MGEARQVGKVVSRLKKSPLIICSQEVLLVELRFRPLFALLSSLFECLLSRLPSRIFDRRRVALLGSLPLVLFVFWWPAFYVKPLQR